ncbi:The BTB (BR-C, ttk and bab)/POZ (Pox virus and Zinc finger) domain [Ceratobasidium sp. AG-Ba]|nr:The BTB (BR-C, ttk and bab)/POZ (Pox virus and Zinc finger) domain [Ceratobasidium sp. AG-Ba]QRW07314.1 The BTB (BR-C, ttk and bab)/POZ (Pox virus and Zinc finger) domain [Ceratobasidium sp. AG-Ba]
MLQKNSTGDKKSEVKGIEATTVIKRHPKFCFDNTLIAIQIEDTLFNVHKYQLMKSTTFSDMFTIAEESEDSTKKQEGLSLENPIVLDRVSASDFECLMTVLYARQFHSPLSHFSSHQPEPEASLIIPAFRLANMWNFTELCAYLMPLAEKALSDVDKIVFAREFKVTDWLLPAHVNLCLREKSVTTQEANKLGLDTLLFMLRFREDRLKEGTGTVTCTGCNRAVPNCYYDCGMNSFSTSFSVLSKPEVETRVQAWLDSGCVLSD